MLLAPGKSVELADPATPGLHVEVSAPGDQTLDLGKVISDTKNKGILVALHAGSKAHGAKKVSVTNDGRVVLKSEKNALPDTASAIARAKHSDCESAPRSASPSLTAGLNTSSAGKTKQRSDDLAGVNAKPGVGPSGKQVRPDKQRGGDSQNASTRGTSAGNAGRQDGAVQSSGTPSGQSAGSPGPGESPAPAGLPNPGSSDTQQAGEPAAGGSKIAQAGTPKAGACT
ncbi:MAG: hypothetical protein FJY54_13855 [Betaproteobacteria bacterium]|nr:hypothetical protein [Betaproteobacteria bacterium]